MPTKSTKTSVIRTKYGERLRLTPTRLVQIDHASNNPWYVTKEDLKTAYQSGSYAVRIFEVRLGGSVRVPFSTLRHSIGCSGFDEKTFRQILRYFGIRKSSSKARA